VSRPATINAKALRSLVTAFVLFGGVGLLLLVGAPALGLHGQVDVQRWLALAHGPWALPAAVAAFALLAFLGAPQVVLIGEAAVVFGPWTGSLYSWIGTFVSALIGFELGRLFGAGVVRDLNSPRVDRFMALVGRNGFAASLVVRLVPGPPFIVVNMAAAVAGVRRGDFAAGTAIGIVPKIALTAFAGGSLTAILNGGGGWMLAGLALAAIVWAGAVLLARRWLKSREAQGAASPDLAAQDRSR
jgi:uncharacterized membrane protein YdjX (TVP38/TMEM64 family)